MNKLILVLMFCVGSLEAQLPQFNVTMTPVDYNLLYTRDIFSDSLLPSSFEYQGTYWNNTQIRFKGHSTRYYPKKSYSVKFPTSNLFRHLRTASFNSMYTDKSFMREKLAWDLFGDMQEMSSRPSYGRLTINDQWKGLYLLIDKPDKYFLIDRGRTVGPLYEASDTYIGADFRLQPDSIMKRYYDKAIGDVKDYSDLEALINAVNAASDSSFPDSIQSYFDVQSLLNWFSGNILMMMGDSYNKNYFLYRDTSRPTQQWVVIPWDYDLSFGRNGDPTIPYPASLLNDDFAYTFPPLSGPSSVLKDRFWNTPSLRELLRQRLDTLLQTVFTDNKQYARIDSIAAVIQNDVALDPDKWGTVNDFREHIEALKYYITARRNYLEKTFINPPGGKYNDVTLPVSQLNMPFHFVAYDGRQLATLWFSNISGLDSVRVRAYPDSTPPNILNPGSGRYVKRWITVTPYPNSATFTAKLQWSYLDVAANNREVGAGVQDEHLLRPFNYDGSGWNVLSGSVNAFGNFVTIDSITEANCGPGKYFALLISETYTQTWYRQPLTNWQRWYDVMFADSQNGFVVGDHGTILRTTDAGASWFEVAIPFSLPFHSLAIPSLQNMFVVGEYGACYNSNDSGKTWSRLDLGTTRNLNSVYFNNSTLGVIAGDSGMLLRTTDGGSTWNQITSIASGYPQNLTSAVSYANYVITGGAGVILGVSDTSVLWSYTSSGGAWNIHGIALEDSSFWWAVGDSGAVIYSPLTTFTPAQVNVAIASSLRDIFVLNQSMLYVSGDGGKIFFTKDRGANWFAQYSADSHDLNGLAFTDSAHGFAVGNGGTILTTSTTGTLTEIKSLTTELPADFRLEQNYPNPFNPTTEVRYEMRDAGFVSLKVFDILGREVAALVNEVKQPGTFSVSWNASNYASGVYFYRLDISSPHPRTQNFTRVRKMLLLK